MACFEGVNPDDVVGAFGAASPGANLDVMSMGLVKSAKKLNVMVSMCLFFLAVVGCTSPDVGNTGISEETVSVILIGSAEHPDPVLEMVQRLENEGILQNVIVRESFPVQIDVTGPASIIKKLQAIPRKISPDFK